MEMNLKQVINVFLQVGEEEGAKRADIVIEQLKLLKDGETTANKIVEVLADYCTAQDKQNKKG